MTTKAKVYKGVACLEINSPDGGKWWYQGGTLAYTPVLISEMSKLRYAVVQGSRKEVLAAPLRIGNQEHLVVLNLPRTDIIELQARGLWPSGLQAPHQTTQYAPWPEYTNNRRSAISMK